MMDPYCEKNGCYMFANGLERDECRKNCRIEQKKNFIDGYLREALRQDLAVSTAQQVEAAVARIYGVPVENVKYDSAKQTITVLMPPQPQWIDITVELETEDPKKFQQVPFEVTDPCPECGAECKSYRRVVGRKVRLAWRCTNPKCNWRRE